jgi:ankyrin repeat protein
MLCTEVLLKASANVELTNNTNGFTSLMKAAQNGHDLCARALLEAGASLHAKSKDNFTMLMAACLGGLVSITEKLIPLSNVDDAVVATHASQGGYTALMYACTQGHKECANALIKGGASTDLETKAGSTALSLAREKGHVALCELLQS